MRLFIAVNLSREVKAALAAAAKELKENSRFGSFSERENLHLTLAFIGETDRANDVIGVMKSISHKRFSFIISGMGKFSRSDGNIVWAGVREYDEMAKLAARLARDLRSAGFNIEKRKFTPHLTLARRVTLYDDADLTRLSASVPKIDVHVDHISLMKSERISGRLVYTEIYRRELA